MCVEARELAMLDDGSPAPAGTTDGELLYPCCFRDASEIRRVTNGAVIPAVIADSWFFWLAIIDGLAAVYILPTVIGIARQVEGLGLVICLNAIPVGWPAALILACLMPRKEISHAPQRQRPAGSSGRRVRSSAGSAPTWTNSPGPGGLRTLASAAVLPGPRAERRRRLAEPDLEFCAFCTRRRLPGFLYPATGAGLGRLAGRAISARRD